MALLKSPLAPVALSLVALGALSALVLHPYVGISVLLLGASLFFFRQEDPRDDAGRSPR